MKKQDDEGKLQEDTKEVEGKKMEKKVIWEKMQNRGT